MLRSRLHRPSLLHRFAGLLPIACSVLVAVILFSLSRNIRSYLTTSTSQGVNSTEPLPQPEPEAEPQPPTDTTEDTSEYTFFDANDATGILVTNMSLVFSILYGFIFNRSYQRFDDISRVFSSECANLHQLVNLIRLIDFDVSIQRDLLVRLRNYAFQIRHECLTGEVLNAGHSVDDLYALIPYVKQLVTGTGTGTNTNRSTNTAGSGNDDDSSTDSVAFDREMLNSSLESIKSLLEARYERWDLFSKSIHGCLKLLLVLSANLTFFGVSLMQSGLPKLDFLYCTLTIVSIAFIMAALSDLDQFFTGFIKLDVSKLEVLFHFSGDSGDEGDGTGMKSSELRSTKVVAAVQPNTANSRRFAEQMMSEVSTSKLRNKHSFKKVSETVLKDIQESRKTKYAMVQVECDPITTR